MSAHRTRWGFHELGHPYARELVRSAHISATDVVVDIGAGKGAITGQLLRTGARVIAVELHPTRAQLLRERFSDLTVLELDVENWRPPRQEYRVVANPPFARLAALLRTITADSRMVQADLVVPASLAARWARGAGYDRGRYAARTVRRLPAAAFMPPATQATAVLRLERRAPGRNSSRAPPRLKRQACPMATRLLLIRHGQSQAQVAGVAAGHATCSGLSTMGVEQVHALADRFARTGEAEGADVVHTSLLARAQQTAEIVTKRLSLPAPVPDCGWCEIHPGDAEGEPWASLPTRWPAKGDPDDLFRRRLPGMETWAEMALRVGTQLRLLADESHSGTLLVVGSGGTVGASFMALGDLPLTHLVSLTRATINASITEWRYDGNRWQLQRFNDAAHLPP